MRGRPSSLAGTDPPSPKTAPDAAKMAAPVSGCAKTITFLPSPAFLSPTLPQNTRQGVQERARAPVSYTPGVYKAVLTRCCRSFGLRRGAGALASRLV